MLFEAFKFSLNLEQNEHRKIKNQNKQRKITYIKMNILLKFITVNFSFLDMEKNLKEEFNCEICEEKFIIDQYYLFIIDQDNEISNSFFCFVLIYGLGNFSFRIFSFGRPLIISRMEGFSSESWKKYHKIPGSK